MPVVAEGPGRGLALRIAVFELRLQTRSPVFLIVVAIAGLMVVGSLTVERLQVGPLRPGNRTSAEAVLAVHLVWSLFFLFTAAAFAAEAALRDETARFGEIVRSTQAPFAALALGRLTGALAAVLLSFASVPVALCLAPLAPWATSLAMPSPVAVSYGWLVLALPNLVLATAVFCALATVARSAMAVYLGAVALLMLYGLASGGEGRPTWLLALLDPFGFGAVRFATTGWTAAERSTTLPPLGGALALNRIVWFGAALGAVMFAVRWRQPMTRAGPPTRDEPGDAAVVTRLPTVARRFDRAALGIQVAARTRLEVGRVARSPFFAALLLLGLANVVGALTQVPPHASSADRLARVDEAFRLVPIVVATFWAGELVWGERDLGLDGIVGASPVPSAVLLLPKILTLLLILGLSLGTAALAAAGLDAWLTGTVRAGRWLLGFALPRTWDAGLLAILAVFLQTIAPGKLAGFGLMVLYLIGALALETTGFHGDLYRYGGASASLDLGQVTSAHALLVRAYWGAAALLLTALAQAFAGRGVTQRLGTRVRRAALDSGPGQVTLLLGTAILAGLLGTLLAI